MSVLRIFVFMLLLPTLAGAAEEIEPAADPDPLEFINRPVFVFNRKMDRFLIRPVAQGYRYIMPEFGERRVGDFFANLYDVNATLNSLLQGRLDKAARAGGRFLINSTLGFFGLFDVATEMGINSFRTDFGHTLAVWGAPEGTFLMVPFIGPRTVRSGVGSVVDIFGSAQYYVEDEQLRWTLYGLELVDTRARLLDVETIMTGDEYIFVRDAYLQQRRHLVNEGAVEDSFSDFEESDWDEEF